MEPAPRPTLEPAGAGAILVSGTALGAAVGALVGWLAGSVAIGALIGVALGIPAGVYGVYRRYRGFFT
jgi:F0F1-type ATP synthase assembly protein I